MTVTRHAHAHLSGKTQQIERKSRKFFIAMHSLLTAKVQMVTKVNRVYEGNWQKRGKHGMGVHLLSRCSGLPPEVPRDRLGTKFSWAWVVAARAFHPPAREDGSKRPKCPSSRRVLMSPMGTYVYLLSELRTISIMFRECQCLRYAPR